MTCFYYLIVACTAAALSSVFAEEELERLHREAAASLLGLPPTPGNANAGATRFDGFVVE